MKKTIVVLALMALMTLSIASARVDDRLYTCNTLHSSVQQIFDGGVYNHAADFDNDGDNDAFDVFEMLDLVDGRWYQSGTCDEWMYDHYNHRNSYFQDESDAWTGTTEEFETALEGSCNGAIQADYYTTVVADKELRTKEYTDYTKSYCWTKLVRSSGSRSYQNLFSVKYNFDTGLMDWYRTGSFPRSSIVPKLVDPDGTISASPTHYVQSGINVRDMMKMPQHIKMPSDQRNFQN